jgi:hypothetical protein
MKYIKLSHQNLSPVPLTSIRLLLSWQDHHQAWIKFLQNWLIHKVVHTYDICYLQHFFQESTANTNSIYTRNYCGSSVRISTWQINYWSCALNCDTPSSDLRWWYLLGENTNKSCVPEEIKSWRTPAKAHCHLVQVLLCSRPLSQNL